MTGMKWMALGACIVGMTACSGSDNGETPRDLRNVTGGAAVGTGGVLGSGGSTAGTIIIGSGGSIPQGTGGIVAQGTGGNKGKVCSSAEIIPEVNSSPGNLLVLFDRSLSMMGNFGNSGSNRFDAVDRALREGLEPFVCPPEIVDGPPCEETLTVGSIMFPTAPNLFIGCPGMPVEVDPIEAATQINWQKVSGFLGAWNAYWAAGNGLLFGTPIEVAFQRGAEAIMASTLPGNTAVLFLTDGESTCAPGEAPDAIAQAATWLGQGIKTYVVSVADAQAAFNDQVATEGGTGQSINPTDPQQLTDAIADIIQETVVLSDCKTTLSGKKIGDIAGACAMGLVSLDGASVPCDAANGFQITSQTEMELFGAACDGLMMGKKLTAEFPCEVLLE